MYHHAMDSRIHTGGTAPYYPYSPTLPSQSLAKCSYQGLSSTTPSSFHSLDFYSQLPHSDFRSLFPSFGTTLSLAYKRVINKVKPVATTLPEDYRIQRRRPSDPLATLPPVLTDPPPFNSGSRLTQERLDALNINRHGFLQPEEVRFLTHILLTHELVLAWDDSERGQFKSSYFDPVRIPTVEHVPWSHKNIPIPPGILQEVMKIIKDKLTAGVYEPSSSSYRSRWFCVLKKDGKSLRLVHDLQPLNAVTIKDAGLPPIADHFIEGFAGLACYSLFDLHVGYDHRVLDELSRDLTTFQTPFGPMRLTKLPMGWTNSVAIFHGDTVFILQDEIPEKCGVFIDDIGVKGPKYRDESPIPENPGIRKFVFDHGIDCNRILHRLGDAGATVSAKKLHICVPEVTILGHLCTQEGRKPDPSSVQKIKDWSTPISLTQLRSFLGMVAYLKIWIRNYSIIARPLTQLLRKDAEFTWSGECQDAMDTLKKTILESPALRPISYDSPLEVIVSVDSSNIAVGFILAQLGEDGKRYFARFGSITWNERESRYSQSKIELYGLFRALHSLKIYIIGVLNLVIEMDASYIKGMLNHPDIHPVAVINRWISAVKLFDFKLRHVPGVKMPATDGLSRRVKAEEDPEEGSDAEEWLDSKIESLFLHELDYLMIRLPHQTRSVESFAVPTVGSQKNDLSAQPILPYPDSTRALDARLLVVHEFLSTLRLPEGISADDKAKIVKQAAQFFVRDGRLYRRDRQGRHQRVVPYDDRIGILKQAHDDLGHRGFFPTRRLLQDRFWWPHMAEDIRWYLKTCYQCQLRSFFKLHLPPSVSQAPSLFQKAYIDTTYMRLQKQFRYR